MGRTRTEGGTLVYHEIILDVPWKMIQFHLIGQKKYLQKNNNILL